METNYARIIALVHKTGKPHLAIDGGRWVLYEAVITRGMPWSARRTVILRNQKAADFVGVAQKSIEVHL